jgi:YbbR domain-containing protein
VRLRDLLFRNLLAKVFSVVFAVVLWAVVIGEKHGQIQMNVSLDLVNIPEKAVVVSDIPTHVAVQIQGPRSLLRTLPGRDIRREVDLKGVGIGWTTVRLLPESIPVPRGMEVLRVTPAALDLRLEPLKEVRLPAAAQFTGEPAAGFRVEGAAVEPPRVLLKGGEGELAGLGGVRTRPVNVAQATSDVEEKAGLELEGLHLVEVSPPKVSVRVKIAPIQMERILDDVQVKAAPGEGRATLVPDRVTVLVKGPMNTVQGLKEGDLQAVVNLQGLEPGGHRVPPTVTGPQGVRVLRVFPPTVEAAVAEK